jgi:hypothetical protein
MPHTRQSVLERVTSEFTLLDEAVRNLSAADWKRPVGRPESKDPWTLKDALAHILVWKDDTARIFRREKRSAERAALAKLNINDSNHRIYEQLKDRPLKDVLAWHRDSQAQLVEAISNAPDTWFERRGRKEWWPWDAVGHSAEHRVKDLEPALLQGKR